jgi:hypothetical protein
VHLRGIHHLGDDAINGGIALKDIKDKGVKMRDEYNGLRTGFNRFCK